jgi:choline dehydrogenase-like flavoprotein
MEEVAAKVGLPDAIYDAIVIGAGQAGLATGYYLKQHKKHFLILEQGSVAGQVWLSRYDSLRLFTPARYSSLPGLPFPCRMMFVRISGKLRIILPATPLFINCRCVPDSAWYNLAAPFSTLKYRPKTLPVLPNGTPPDR